MRILGDSLESRKEWTAFFIYSLLFEYYMSGIRKMQIYDCFEKYEGLIYRIIALKSLNDTNKAF